jgi:hypothetical protein
MVTEQLVKCKWKINSCEINDAVIQLNDGLTLCSSTAIILSPFWKNFIHRPN